MQFIWVQSTFYDKTNENPVSHFLWSQDLALSLATLSSSCLGSSCPGWLGAPPPPCPSGARARAPPISNTCDLDAVFPGEACPPQCCSSHPRNGGHCLLKKVNQA